MGLGNAFVGFLFLSPKDCSVQQRASPCRAYSLHSAALGNEKKIMSENGAVANC